MTTKISTGGKYSVWRCVFLRFLFATVFRFCLCVAIVHLQTLPYQNRVVAICFSCIVSQPMAAILNLKMADLYVDRKNNLLQSS